MSEWNRWHQPIISIGDTFFRWTVTELPHGQTGDIVCVCECGVRRLRSRRAWRDGKSCGCLTVEVAKQQCGPMHRTHGLSKTPEYYIWKSIIRRCENPHCEKFHCYGGRGISIYPGWRHDFPAFLSSVGPRPGPKYSIDRENNEGNYEPGNVRWVASQKEQARNTRINRTVTIGERTMCVSAWAETSGIPYPTIMNRINAGVTGEWILSKEPLTRFTAKYPRGRRGGTTSFVKLLAGGLIPPATKV